MSRRRRSLSGEERALWESVARTAVALRPIEAPPDPPVPEPPSAPVIESSAAAKPPPAAKGARRMAPPPAPHPPLHPIERRTISRLARGTIDIDARIDLHGMTQLAAHERLHRFLRDQQAAGARVVLVITGKGRPATTEGHAFEERGVLRRRVPHWLAEPGLRSIVVGFEEAHRAHGGGGALYVRIRRRGGAGARGPS